MRLLQIARAPSWRLFLSLLLTVVLAEAAAMLLLGFFMDSGYLAGRVVLFNLLLLTVFSAPVLWVLLLMEVHGRRTSYNDRPAIISVAADVTDRKRAEGGLKKNERDMREIAAVLAEGIYVLDAEQRLTFMNPAAERMLGWTERELLGQEPHAVFHYEAPSGRHVPLEECPVYLSTRSGEIYRNHEDYFVRKDGSWLPVAVVSAPIVRDGNVVGSVAAFHDISERLDSQRELREKEERYRMLFNSGSDAIFVHRLEEGNRPGVFVEVNDVACSRLGYTREELLAMTPHDIEPSDAEEETEVLMQRLEREKHVMAERVHVAKDGRRIPVEINAHRFEFKGEPLAISVARDITDRKQAEERIQYMAHHDALTGLANRRMLMDRLEQALAQARRFGRRLAVLFVDLDGFKPVNDTMGHDAGDLLLQTIADRLHACVRKGDTVSRMGGDEFVILLAEIHDVRDADTVARKVMEAVAEPVVMASGRVRVTASVGISTWPGGGEGAEALIRNADAAMYRAKQQKKNHVYRNGGDET